MTYYDILGVSHDASMNEIKTAYRNMVKAFHPDYYHGDKAFAEAKTKELNEAYETLKDDELRRLYDERMGFIKKKRTYKRKSSSNQENNMYEEPKPQKPTTQKLKPSYDESIFYPGFKLTGDWYADAIKTYSHIPSPKVVRSQFDYSEKPMPVEFGLNAGELSDIQRRYETSLKNGNDWARNLKNSEANLIRINNFDKILSIPLGLIAIISTFGIMGFPTFLFFYILDYLVGTIPPRVPLNYIFITGLMLLNTFICNGLMEKLSDVKKRLDEREEIRWKYFDEEIRRYIQYQYALMEYDLYQKTTG